MAKVKLGLALGGGGALGWSHLGVLQVLRGEGIQPDIITGTSIGSLVGACEAAGKFDELLSIATAMTRLSILRLTDVQIGKNGVLGGDPVVAELRKHLDALKIEDLSRPFGAVATDLVAGREVRLTSGDLVEAVRASISIPGVFTPVRKDGMLLVDGGLLNNVPVSLARDLGAERVIGVNITADFEGRAELSGLANPHARSEPPKPDVSLKKPKQAMTALTESIGRYLRKEDKEPTLLGISLTSVALLMRELGRAQLANAPADVTLEPRVGHISMIEFDRAAEMIALGRQAAEEKLPEIIALAEGRDAL